MTYRTLGIFALIGAFAWTGATFFYAAFADAVIETGPAFYAVNAVLTGAMLMVLFSGLTKAFRVRRHELLAAALAFAIPSIFLSIAFAPGALRLLADGGPQTAGRYGVYLFFAYMLVLAAAVTPRPVLQRA